MTFCWCFKNVHSWSSPIWKIILWHICFTKQFVVESRIFLNLSFQICAGQRRRARARGGEKVFRVTTAGARLRRFGINPLWLTSMVEIKAAICLKRLNNVRHSVKHTPAALYIMHQRPAEGLLQKDNMTYPRERWREREGGREAQREGGREGGRRWAGRHLQR